MGREDDVGVGAPDAVGDQLDEPGLVAPALDEANLRTTAASGVALSSEDAVLGPGTYSAAGLLGGGAGASLIVGANGRITSYVPLGSVPPLAARLFELSRVQ